MRVGVDICNTIANVNLELLRHFETITFEKYPFPEVPRDFFMSGEGLRILRKAEPFPGAARVLYELSSKGCQIVYVTSRSRAAEFITRRWLEIHRFPKRPVFFVPQDEKADFAVKKKVVLFFEDEPCTATAMLDAGIQVLLKDWPYNRHVKGKNLKRFKSWREIKISDWRAERDER
ncbi:putative HAD superfamily protein [Desulfohalotomaculum tongense]|uniref:5' nucleotidase, NT5C type n=1 Tax=Desulforadius tongensis TaxID=1216062 RepID=UPI00195D9D02|nr:hypothetical protein [Desulforadius tongensis]MBM7854924.1 putative HAD superfamily protein [Desulforadius tongensis]